MDKRYQIFVSSTYLDLKKARQELLHELLKDNYIPMGMELFPATSNDLPQYIKSVIDESDYYILIIGGRYGTIMKGDKGISYTEMEYEYAAEKKIPILVFTHIRPDELDNRDPENKAKLDKFRQKVIDENNREPGRWETPEKLALEVMRSLRAAERTTDRPGWVRGGVAPFAEPVKEQTPIPKKDTAPNTPDESSKPDNNPAPPQIEELNAEVPSSLLPQNYAGPTTGPMSWGEYFTYIATRKGQNGVFRGSINPMCLDGRGVERSTIRKLAIKFNELGLIEEPLGDLWKLMPAGDKFLKEELYSSVQRLSRSSKEGIGLDAYVPNDFLRNSMLEIKLSNITLPISWRQFFIAIQRDEQQNRPDQLDSYCLYSDYRENNERYYQLGSVLEKLGLVNLGDRLWELTPKAKKIIKEAALAEIQAES